MKTTIKHGPESCRSDPPMFTIETVEDYKIARRRLKALTVQDGSSYRESIALREAIRIWEADHASVTEPPARAP